MYLIHTISYVPTHTHTYIYCECKIWKDMIWRMNILQVYLYKRIDIFMYKVLSF